MGRQTPELKNIELEVDETLLDDEVDLLVSCSGCNDEPF